MMRGGHGDNYYYQLVANVRRYKGVPALRKASGPVSIPSEGSFHLWRSVRPEYWDPVGETLPRDFDGVAKQHYVNRTGRNDFELMKVARDDQNVYFYARTHDPITPWNGGNWMMLLIDADGNPSTGWEGYDFIVNRTVLNDTTTVLEKNTGGWNWTKVAEVSYRVEGNELQLAIPRAALGLPTGKTGFTLDFKWADNLQRPGDVMDFYLSGDVAPDGRFKYRYLAQ